MSINQLYDPATQKALGISAGGGGGGVGSVFVPIAPLTANPTTGAVVLGYNLDAQLTATCTDAVLVNGAEIFTWDRVKTGALFIANVVSSSVADKAVKVVGAYGVSTGTPYVAVQFSTASITNPTQLVVQICIVNQQDIDEN